MRYSKETTPFWSLGYKLFKGKFLRFMGGQKSSISDNECSKLINFVIPDCKRLQKDIDSVDIDCERPGIINTNIENFASVHKIQRDRGCI